MKHTINILFLIGFLLGNVGFAQHSMPEVERELKGLAEEILLHDSLRHKIKQNKAFTRLLIQTLERPESYSYAFDSLKTISILSPADKSFRIFTWHIVDKNRSEYYGEQYHYYFGLVQRKYEENGSPEYVVIPLIEMPKIIQGVENMVLDNNNWLGALYYKPQDSDYLPEVTIKTIDRRGKKVKKKLYVMLGWNGNDNRSNYKMVDVLSFDDEEKDKVLFGADIFYFDAIPKYRALFKYSEYAPFSLNYNWVKTGRFGWNKNRMIIYDHLGTPKTHTTKLKEVWEMGPDGSYDALYFYKRRGYFEWYRDAQLAEKYISKLHLKRQKEIRKNQKSVAENREDSFDQMLSEGGEEFKKKYQPVEASSSRSQASGGISKKDQKKMLKEMEELRKKEEEKLKEAGIMDKKNKKKN